jgi:group I intron endonuclease
MRYSILNIPKSWVNQPGIYSIININNGKRYVGQSGNIFRRLVNHLNDLLQDSHYNEYLQRSFNKHTKNAFLVEVLQYCENDEFKLLEAEQHWIDFYQSYDKDKGYNWGPCAANPFKGAKHTDETKQKISLLNKGRKMPEGFGENLSHKLTGRKRKQWEINNIKQGIIEKKAHEKEKKRILLVSPEGEVIEIFGIREFCKTARLCRSSIHKLLRGERIIIAGWKLFDGENAYSSPILKKGTSYNPEERSRKIREARMSKTTRKRWKIIQFLSPDGQVYEVNNLSSLSRTIGIPQYILSSLARGDRKQYQGWKILKAV